MSVSSVVAGGAFVKIAIDSAELNKGIKDAQTKLQRFISGINAWSTQVALVSAMIQAPFVKAIQIFSDFDLKMRQVKAITGATGKAFAELTEQARKLGRETSFTTSQVAAGMVELGRLGLSVKEVKNAIQPVMNLAKATGDDLAIAAQVAGNQMRIFNMESEDISGITDVITYTVNKSAMTLNDFAEAAAKAGPNFANTGADIKQMSASLGILANMGIKGSLAGTALSRSIKRLADPNVKAFLRTFGIDVENADRSMKPLHQNLEEISKVMSSLSHAEKIHIAEEIFEVRGSLAGLPLTANATKIEEFLNGLNACAGLAAKTASEMDAGLYGSIKRLESAVNDLSIELGKLFEVSFIGLINDISKLINKFVDGSKKATELFKVLFSFGTIVTLFGVVAKSFSLWMYSLKQIFSPIIELDKLLSGAAAKAELASKAQEKRLLEQTALSARAVAAEKARTAAELGEIAKRDAANAKALKNKKKEIDKRVNDNNAQIAKAKAKIASDVAARAKDDSTASVKLEKAKKELTTIEATNKQLTQKLATEIALLKTSDTEYKIKQKTLLDAKRSTESAENKLYNANAKNEVSKALLDDEKSKKIAMERTALIAKQKQAESDLAGVKATNLKNELADNERAVNQKKASIDSYKKQVTAGQQQSAAIAKAHEEELSALKAKSAELKKQLDLQTQIATQAHISYRNAQRDANSASDSYKTAQANASGRIITDTSELEANVKKQQQNKVLAQQEFERAEAERLRHNKAINNINTEIDNTQKLVVEKNKLIQTESTALNKSANAGKAIASQQNLIIANAQAANAELKTQVDLLHAESAQANLVAQKSARAANLASAVANKANKKALEAEDVAKKFGQSPEKPATEKVDYKKNLSDAKAQEEIAKTSMINTKKEALHKASLAREAKADAEYYAQLEAQESKRLANLQTQASAYSSASAQRVSALKTEIAEREALSQRTKANLYAEMTANNEKSVQRQRQIKQDMLNEQASIDAKRKNITEYIAQEKLALEQSTLVSNQRINALYAERNASYAKSEQVIRGIQLESTEQLKSHSQRMAYLNADLQSQKLLSANKIATIEAERNENIASANQNIANINKQLSATIAAEKAKIEATALSGKQRDALIAQMIQRETQAAQVLIQKQNSIIASEQTTAQQRIAAENNVLANITANTQAAIQCEQAKIAAIKNSTALRIAAIQKEQEMEMVATEQKVANIQAVLTAEKTALLEIQAEEEAAINLRLSNYAEFANGVMAHLEAAHMARKKQIQEELALEEQQAQAFVQGKNNQIALETKYQSGLKATIALEEADLEVIRQRAAEAKGVAATASADASKSVKGALAANLAYTASVGNRIAAEKLSINSSSKYTRAIWKVSQAHIIGIGIQAKHAKTILKASLIELYAAKKIASGSALKATFYAIEGAAAKVAALATLGFKFAMDSIVAHPVMAALVAIAGVFALIRRSINKAAEDARNYTEYLDKSVAKIEKNREELKKLNKEHNEDIKYLIELEKQTSTTAEQQIEANSIIENLNKSYGNLGITIDRLTGKLNGATEAQKKMNEEQRRKLLNNLHEEIVHDAQNAQSQIEGLYPIAKSNAGWLSGWLTLDGVSNKQKNTLEKIGYEYQDRMVNTWVNPEMQFILSHGTIEDIEKYNEKVWEAFNYATTKGLKEKSELEKLHGILNKLIERKKEYNAVFNGGRTDGEEEIKNRPEAINPAPTKSDAEQAEQQTKNISDSNKNKFQSSLYNDIDAIKKEEEEYKKLTKTMIDYYSNEKKIADEAMKKNKERRTQQQRIAYEANEKKSKELGNKLKQITEDANKEQERFDTLLQNTKDDFISKMERSFDEKIGQVDHMDIFGTWHRGKIGQEQDKQRVHKMESDKYNELVQNKDYKSAMHMMRMLWKPNEYALNNLTVQYRKLWNDAREQGYGLTMREEEQSQVDIKSEALLEAIKQLTDRRAYLMEQYNNASKAMINTRDDRQTSTIGSFSARALNMGISPENIQSRIANATERTRDEINTLRSVVKQIQMSVEYLNNKIIQVQ